MRVSPRVSLGLFGLALLIVGWLVWQRDNPEAVPVVLTASMPSGEKPFVPSMQDTYPDGDLRAFQTVSPSAQEVGNLAYGELKRLFDYYLSAVGEQSIAAITQQIRNELDRRLPPAQASKAHRLLGLYIEFKRELIELDSKPELAGTGVQAVRRRMLAMQDLRARYFSADETQGMFGFDDAYDMDAVARLEVSQDSTLTEQQKKSQLRALDAAMPDNLRREREASNVVVRVEQQALELRAAGGSEDDIYRMRAKAFDAPAAARLAEVDREDATWKSRIARYLDERRAFLDAHTTATSQERENGLAQLRQTHFTEAERPRLVAYE